MPPSVNPLRISKAETDRLAVYETACLKKLPEVIAMELNLTPAEVMAHLLDLMRTKNLVESDDGTYRRPESLTDKGGKPPGWRSHHNPAGKVKRYPGRSRRVSSHENLATGN